MGTAHEQAVNLKHRWLPAVVGPIALAGVIFLHRYSPPMWPSLGSEILRALHGPGFAVLALAVFWSLQGRYVGVRRYLIAAAVAMTAGLIAEAAQIPGPRSAELRDIVIDGVGILSALGIVALFDDHIRSRLAAPYRLILLPIFVCTLGIAIVPALWLSFTFAAQMRAVPTLLTFEHPWEKTIAAQNGSRLPEFIDAPVAWPAAGTTVAHATEDGRWGLLLVVRPYMDWRGYSEFRFLAASATEVSYRVGIAIRDMKPHRDSAANRFYKTLDIGPVPQWHSITFEEIDSIGGDRPFDFAHVEAIVLSAASPGDGVELLIDEMRLH